MSFQYSGESLPCSQNPQPNVFPAALVRREMTDIPGHLQEALLHKIARQVLDAFWLDMGFACNSAVAQSCAGHDLHVMYDDLARRNRDRIAADLEVEKRSLRRMNGVSW